jgi:hypothetical protein
MIHWRATGSGTVCPSLLIIQGQWSSWGPNLEVSIAAVTEQGTTLAHHEVGALIDTGSQSSCISPRLAPKMEGGLRGVRSLPHIYGLLDGPPTIRGLVWFKDGVEFIRDFSVLDQLAPYDVLIGRDILREVACTSMGVRVTFGSTSRTEGLRRPSPRELKCDVGQLAQSGRATRDVWFRGCPLSG